MKNSSPATGHCTPAMLIRPVVFAVIGCLLCTGASAQKVSTLISKDKIVLGEQIMVKIKVEGLEPGSIQQDFSFPDTVNHLEILSDSTENIGNSEIIHTLTITSFDSGYWQLPSFSLLLNDKRTLATEPLNIAVLPVDVSNMQDYHDIKDILEVQPQNDWWVIASIVIAAILSLFAVLWFTGSSPADTTKRVHSPANLQQLYQQILKRLDELPAADLSGREAVAAAFAEVSQLLRTFTDAAYLQKTAHMTTGEYMLALKGKLPDAGMESSYFQLLRLADAVKFAKYLPPEAETSAAFPVAKNTVAGIYEQNKPAS